jgi:hypothetical protein
MRSPAIIALAGLITGCAGGHVVPPTPVARQPYSVFGCGIFGANGVAVREFPGNRCRYFPDGSVISGDNKTLTRYDANMRVLWRLETQNHHIINVTSDGNFLIGGSDVRIYRGKRTRFDVLEKRDMNGKVVGAFDFFEHLKEFAAADRSIQIKRLTKFDWDLESLPGVEMEFSHMNSYYEIPKNSNALKIPAFREGNIVVNANTLGRIFILDSELTKILWVSKYKNHVLHDVQILQNGNLLIYDNERGLETQFSALEEYDPIQRKRVWEYRADPQESFHAECCGGIQTLENGDILYSDTSGGGRAVQITRGGYEVWQMASPFHDDITGQALRFQDVKRYDISEFLKNNHGF